MLNPLQDRTRSRRDFIKTGSIAAAVAAVTGAPRAIAAPPPPEPGDPAAQDYFVDVKQFGAVGDGRTDDSAAFLSAIEHAKTRRIREIRVPAGVFMIGKTLKLSTDLHLVGEGRSFTTLKAIAGTRFDKFKPDPRTADLRQRCAMITTEGIGSVRKNLVTGVAVKCMTIDWNNAPCDAFGSAVLLMDSCDHALLYDLDLINCMPSDHPREENQKKIGDRFRCECVLFSNARYGVMDNCRLTDSGYRPLSVSYGSRKITFKNGVIHAENPVRRHVWAECHGDAIRRDAAFVRPEVMFLNSTFILEGGKGGFDGISSHGGIAHVENCDFYVSKQAPKTFRVILKPFGGVTHCTYINNRFHLDQNYEGQFSIVANDDEGAESVTFAGNIVHASYGELEPENIWRMPIRFTSKYRRIIIRDNLFNLEFRGKGPAPKSVIQLDKVDAFVVSNNIIEVKSVDGGTVPEAAILLQDVGSGVVIGNHVPVIKVEGESKGLVLLGNATAEP